MYLDYNESSCRQNYSFFATASYLRNGLHLTAIFTVPLSFFTFYAILKVTPERMKNMRIPLLIVHAWSTNLDLMFTVYTAPLMFFPSAAGLPLGLLATLGVAVKWQAYWGQVSVIMMGVCFLMLYENRQSQITTIRFKIKSKLMRLAYFALNYLFAFTIVLPFYLDDTDQMEMRKVVLKRIPCPTIEFYDPNTYVLLKGGELLPFWCITIGMSAVVFQTLFFISHTVYHLNFIKNANVSSATRSLQRKFLGYVSIQITIPMLALSCPITYSLYAEKHNYYNQAYNNNAILVMANHGLLSTCSALFIYKPYRDFVKSFFIGKIDVRTTSSTVESMSKRQNAVLI